MMKEKKIGMITHYFTHLRVAVVKLEDDLSRDDEIMISGKTTSFRQMASSIQIDKKPIESAKAGQSVGLKIVDRVREGDFVYKLIDII